MALTRPSPRLIAIYDNINTWSAAQRYRIVTLSMNGEDFKFTPNMDVGNDFLLILHDDCILANPINIVPGQSGVFIIGQDEIGSKGLVFGTFYKWPNGEPPIISEDPGAFDHVYYHVVSEERIHCTWMGNFS